MDTQIVKESLLNQVRERRSRYRPWLALAVCVAIFWGIPRLLHVPTLPGMSGSLNDRPIVNSLVVAVLLIGSTLLGQFIAGQDHIDNGLWAATAGLVVFAHRCGPMRYVLFYSQGTGVFIHLAGELVLLYALLYLAHAAVGRLCPPADRIEPDRPVDGVMTLLTHAAVTGACMLLLAASDDTQQALFAVGVSAFIASVAVQYTFPSRHSAWYWGGPLITGLAGYIAAYFNPLDFEIGYPQGSFAALARALPLHYASAGAFGALIGLWTARGWQLSNQAATDGEAREGLIV